MSQFERTLRKKATSSSRGSSSRCVPNAEKYSPSRQKTLGAKTPSGEALSRGTGWVMRLHSSATMRSLAVGTNGPTMHPSWLIFLCFLVNLLIVDMPKMGSSAGSKGKGKFGRSATVWTSSHVLTKLLVGTGTKGNCTSALQGPRKGT